jgi:hypothetical protein
MDMHVPKTGDHELSGRVDDGGTGWCLGVRSDTVDQASAQDDGNVGYSGAAGGVNYSDVLKN